MRSHRLVIATALLAALLSRPAAASFHVMQVEQVIGDVNSSGQNIQAIQLRMRSSFQNIMSQGRLVVRDATGANPVVLIDFTSNVPNSAAGARVLAATANFSSATIPPLTPDFTLMNPIPPSYFAAGTLTYEDDFNTIYWRLSWGGASYTGIGTGSFTNDANGQFNPPFAGPLPTTTAQALLFQGTTSAASTTNLADYALTAGDAVFTNNAGASGTINNVLGVGADATGRQLALGLPSPNPARSSIAYSVDLPRAARVQVRVLDISGRAVRTLVNESMPSGRHALTWNASTHAGSSLPVGMYFLELNAGGATRVRRFVLIQ